MAEIFPAPRLEIQPGMSRYKTYAITTEPKSGLSDIEIDYNLEAMPNLLCVEINGESDGP